MKKWIKDHKYMACEIVLFLALVFIFPWTGIGIGKTLLLSLVLAAAVGGGVILPLWFTYEFMGLGAGKLPGFKRKK